MVAPSTSTLERAAFSWIDERQDELVELTAALLRFDTHCVEPAYEPGARNEEAECQAFLQERLRRIGADVEEIRPDPVDFAAHPMMPPGHHWDGRSMTLARIPGGGGGDRSLIVNGHVDVVSAEPMAEWSRPPFGGVVENGRVYGRGASDMKGGIASALFALEALQAIGVRLSSDLWFQVVTDEETSGMGTVAMAKLAPTASAGVCPEPTSFSAWVACRGILYGRIELRGRAAHGELHQGHWREGGGVSAIAKLRDALEAIDEVNGEWRGRPDKIHPLLSTPTVVATLVEGGEFIASYPAHAALTFDTTYLPGNADEAGYGSPVKTELEQMLMARMQADPWLSESPPTIAWITDYPPYEFTNGENLLSAVDSAGSSLGLSIERVGLDSWHDAASLGLFAGIPAISFGPGDAREAHRVDEAITVERLVLGAKSFAGLYLHYCGVAGEAEQR